MSRLVIVLFAFILSGSVYGKTAKPTLILLSIDGFAYDYLAKYKPKNILAFAKSGASAKLLPVYPSKTFPNHLSIITGVYPQKHGIIHNKFYHPNLDEQYRLGAGKNNSAWLTAKPFWSFAEENNIISAVYFWPESEVKGQSIQPTYNIPYNRTDTDETKFNQIISWLKLPEPQAPGFIVGYFSSVDEVGHEFGIDSTELAQAIANIDDFFGDFIERLQQEISQSVNIILLSDHGMMQVDKNKNIDLSTVFSEQVIALIAKKSLIVTKSTTQLFVHFDQEKIKKAEQNKILQSVLARQKLNTNLYSVYQKNNYPSHWQFNNNLAITPDFIVEAAPTASFIYNNVSVSSATHGYDPLNQPELAAIFFAAGPNIIKGRAVNSVENIHVVPLMTQLLGLKQLENIDGKISKLAPILQINY